MTAFLSLLLLSAPAFSRCLTPDPCTVQITERERAPRLGGGKSLAALELYDRTGEVLQKRIEFKDERLQSVRAHASNAFVVVQTSHYEPAFPKVSRVDFQWYAKDGRKGGAHSFDEECLLRHLSNEGRAIVFCPTGSAEDGYGVHALDPGDKVAKTWTIVDPDRGKHTWGRFSFSSSGRWLAISAKTLHVIDLGDLSHRRIEAVSDAWIIRDDGSLLAWKMEPIVSGRPMMERKFVVEAGANVVVRTEELRKKARSFPRPCYGPQCQPMRRE